MSHWGRDTLTAPAQAFKPHTGSKPESRNLADDLVAFCPGARHTSTARGLCTTALRNAAPRTESQQHQNPPVTGALPRPGRRRTTHRPAAALPELIGAVLTGLGTVIASASFAALIFAGPIAPHLGRGIGIALSSVLTGPFLAAMGLLRAGRLIRFLPNSVVGGFLAGTRLLLLIGGLRFGAALSHTSARGYADAGGHPRQAGAAAGAEIRESPVDPGQSLLPAG